MHRALVITSTFPRWKGDATPAFVLSLAQDLAAVGWKANVLAPHAPGAQRRENFDGIEAERFRYQWPERLQTLCYDGGAAFKIRQNRLNWLNVPPFLLAECWTAMRAARRGIDLVNAHWIIPQGVAGLLAARAAGLPLVLTVHGGDVFSFRGPAAIRMKQWLLGAADAVTTNSSATEAVLRELCPRANIVRVPMGVDIVTVNAERVATIRRQQVASGGSLLVFAGRLLEEKGVLDLIDAIALLAPDYPALRCLVVGEGPLRSECEARVAALGLTRVVTFVGWLEAHEVANHLAAADCFVGLSKRSPQGWIEAQGLTFIEAMAAGTPVVATRCGGIPDAVRDGETGLLVEEGDAPAAAAAIRRLIDTPELGARLGRAGRELALREFSRQRSAERFAAVFDDCLAHRRRNADA